VRDSEKCRKYLNAVIGELSKAFTMKDSQGNQLTASSLVGMLGSHNIQDNAPRDQTGGPAYTNNGVVHLTSSAYTSYLYATLIHEAFHLTKGLYNDDLSAAMKKADEGWGPLPGAGDERTGYVARSCGGL